jgi:hypothetical protein
MGGSIAGIIVSAIGMISIYNNVINGEYKLEALNIFFKSKFTIVLCISICVIVFIIGIVNILFSGDIDFHIDLNTKRLVLIQGRKPFLRNISIDFTQIKEINILRTEKTARAGNRYKPADHYILDIYDNDLNAYSCYDTADIETIIEIADELSMVFDVKVMDRTHCADYEGFKRRVL